MHVPGIPGRVSWRKLKTMLWRRLRQVVRYADAHLPAGVRSAAGVLLAIGGMLGFLPILGLWMLPAGLMLIALDVPPLRRRVLLWLELPAQSDQPGG